MSFDKVTETTKGAGSDSDLTQTTYRRSWTLRGTTGLETDDDAYTYMRVNHSISPGAAHPVNALARAISASVQRRRSSRLWDFTASYSNAFDHQENPVNDEIQITGDEEDFQRPLIYDSSGDAVLNSAGDPPAEPLTAEDGKDVRTIVVNVTAVPGWFYTHKRAINSDAFTIDGETIAARHARINKRSKSWWKYRGSHTYRTITVVMEIREPSKPDFRYRWLDQGFRRKPTADEITDGLYDATERVRMKIRGEEANEPLLLDGSGAQLDDPSPGTAYINETIWHPELTFAGTIPGCT